MLTLLGLIACFGAAESLAPLPRDAHVVLLQQHAQRSFKQSFAHAFLEVEHEGALDRQVFKVIEEQVMTLETTLIKDRKSQLMEYEKELEIAHNNTRAVKLMNTALETELEDVKLNNVQMREKAINLKQENFQLSADVRKLRNGLSAIVERKSAALENAEKNLNDEAAELHELLQADASHRPEIALIQFGIAQTHARNKSMDLMGSLKTLMDEAMQRHEKSDTELKAAFIRALKAAEAERAGFLKAQMELNQSLAEAKITSTKLADVVRNFEETKQRLTSLRSSLRQQLPDEPPAIVGKAGNSFDDSGLAYVGPTH